MQNRMQFFLSFFFFFFLFPGFFETGFLWVALGVLELTLYVEQAGLEPRSLLASASHECSFIVLTGCLFRTQPS